MEEALPGDDNEPIAAHSAPVCPPAYPALAFLVHVDNNFPSFSSGALPSVARSLDAARKATNTTTSQPRRIPHLFALPIIRPRSFSLMWKRICPGQGATAQ